jgi:hypothetical protein
VDIILIECRSRMVGTKWARIACPITAVLALTIKPDARRKSKKQRATTLNGSFGSYVTNDGLRFLLKDNINNFATKPSAPNRYTDSRQGQRDRAR